MIAINIILEGQMWARAAAKTPHPSPCQCAGPSARHQCSGHLWAPRKIRAFGLRGAMFGREALFEGFEGSPFQESRLGGPGKGVPSAAMGARVVEMRPLSRYASVAVRSRKANRLMLYTRFIRPIFALARTRPIVRTILPPMLVC